MNVTSEAGMNNTVKSGLSVTVQAAGPAQIQGLPVKIN
jgi:hypothetical protein